MSGTYLHLWNRVEGLENLSHDDLQHYLGNIIQQVVISERVRLIQAMVDDSEDQMQVIMLESTVDHLLDVLNGLMERRWELLRNNGLTHLY